MFCRDFVSEALSPQHFVALPGASLAPTVDKLIKAMINFELFGLMDCAVDLAQHYRTQLLERIDVDEAIDRLIYRPAHARYTVDVADALRMISTLRVRVRQNESAVDKLTLDKQKLESAVEKLTLDKQKLESAVEKLTLDKQKLESAVEELSRSLDTTKVLAARLGRRLATAPARLWRRYLA
jgi:vacuolar-type H+-ATPase subunit I/STV1